MSENKFIASDDGDIVDDTDGAAYHNKHKNLIKVRIQSLSDEESDESEELPSEEESDDDDRRPRPSFSTRTDPVNDDGSPTPGMAV